jgi:GMP synthase-like glutamine amidotransferase
MIQPNKFKDLNKRFKSLETGMTHMNKFEELNDRFTSLGTGMTQPNKFEDRECTLLLDLYC